MDVCDECGSDGREGDSIRTNARLVPQGPTGSDATRRYVTIDLASIPDEDNAVSGWVSLVPFDLVVRDDDLFSDVPVRAAERSIGAVVRDDRDISMSASSSYESHRDPGLVGLA